MLYADGYLQVPFRSEEFLKFLNTVRQILQDSSRSVQTEEERSIRNLRSAGTTSPSLEALLVELLKSFPTIEWRDGAEAFETLNQLIARRRSP